VTPDWLEGRSFHRKIFRRNSNIVVDSITPIGWNLRKFAARGGFARFIWLVRNSTSVRRLQCGRKLGNRLVVDPVEMSCSVDALAIAIRLRPLQARVSARADRNRHSNARQK
jgi:hypothetical protein